MASRSVFISYSHDSLEHAGRVRALASRLVQDGFDVRLDAFEKAPIEGWALWSEKQIRDCNFVLVVGSRTYLRRAMRDESPGLGLGAAWEAPSVPT